MVRDSSTGELWGSVNEWSFEGRFSKNEGTQNKKAAALAAASNKTNL
jgi:hypothetical protein